MLGCLATNDPKPEVPCDFEDLVVGAAVMAIVCSGTEAFDNKEHIRGGLVRDYKPTSATS